jgi:hypothetical protein
VATVASTLPVAGSKVSPDREATHSPSVSRFFTLPSIARARESGHIASTYPAADVRSMVISLAMTWSPSSLTYTATTADAAADHERRRTSLAAAVRGASTPGPAAP